MFYAVSLRKLVRLILPSVLVAVMVLALTPSSSGNAVDFEIKVVGAPTDVTVCSTFTVDIMITSLVPGAYMTGFQIRVFVDLGFMKIVSAENHIAANG